MFTIKRLSEVIYSTPSMRGMRDSIPATGTSRKLKLSRSSASDERSLIVEIFQRCDLEWLLTESQFEPSDLVVHDDGWRAQRNLLQST